MTGTFKVRILLFYFYKQQGILDGYRRLYRCGTEQERIAAAYLARRIPIEYACTNGLILEKQRYCDGGAVAGLQRHLGPFLFPLLINGLDVFSISNLVALYDHARQNHIQITQCRARYVWASQAVWLRA